MYRQVFAYDTSNWSVNDPVLSVNTTNKDPLKIGNSEFHCKISFHNDILTEDIVIMIHFFSTKNM